MTEFQITKENSLLAKHAKELTEKLHADPSMPRYVEYVLRRERVRALEAFREKFGDEAHEELLQKLGYDKAIQTIGRW